MGWRGRAQEAVVQAGEREEGRTARVEGSREERAESSGGSGAVRSGARQSREPKGACGRATTFIRLPAVPAVELRLEYELVVW